MNVTGGTVYPYIHHSRYDEEKPKPDASTEPQLKCTWHCFCVALKALSGGIVLLIVGSLMTTAGIMAEENLINTANKFPNGSLSDPHDIETLAAYRNLSFAGPVVLGLGGIVVLAALILTFESRDTLGVKVAPTKLNSTTIATPKSDIHVISTTLIPLAQCSSSRAKMSSESLSLPLNTLLTEGNTGESNKSGFSKDRLQETIMETNLGDASAYEIGLAESPGSGMPPRSPARDEKAKVRMFELRAGEELSSMSRRSHRNKTISLLFDLHSPHRISRTDSSHLLSPSDTIEHYFDLPSPQDTELSDPEGCSIELPSSWRSARCSSTTSPFSISLSALDLFFKRNAHPTDDFALPKEPSFKHQQLQQKLLAQQRRLLHEQEDRKKQIEVLKVKTIASIESDGLSSSSSVGGAILQDDDGEEEEEGETVCVFSRDSSFERSNTRQTASSSSSTASGSTVVNYRSRSGAHISFTTI